MKQIGFKNFRKFENFPTMDLGDITILVGGNNAGKSTVVKALLLTFDNMRSMNWSTKNLFITSPKFRLDANNIHNIHIGEFNRALYNGANKSEMEFLLTIGNFTFLLTVTGSVDNKVETNVSKIEVTENNKGIKFVFDYENAKMSVDIEEDNNEGLAQLVALDHDLEDLSVRLKEEKNPEMIANINASIKRLRTRRNSLVNPWSSKSNKVSVSTTMETYVNIANENVIVNQIRSFAQYISNAPQIANKKSKEYKEELEKKRELDGMQIVFNEIANELNFVLGTKSIEYIYAHAANQNAVYTTDDKNDYLAQTIRDFKDENINKGHEEDLFIKKWMGTDGFCMGYDYEIEGVLGSAFGIKIKTSEREDGKYVQLADMGMGSIQMMILLFKLATFISKYKGRTVKPTIVIEEPEQNLHPKIQSLLADLFAELNSKYGFKFIVETHSEYLVRKTQAIIANKNYEDETVLKENNPFVVYYFDGKDENQSYYPMEYEISGAFRNKFGEGFFDEASRWDMTIIRKEFELKKKNRK